MKLFQEKQLQPRSKNMPARFCHTSIYSISNADPYSQKKLFPGCNNLESGKSHYRQIMDNNKITRKHKITQNYSTKNTALFCRHTQTVENTREKQKVD